MKEHCCIICNKKTVSVINTEEGPVCYNCYSDKKNPPKQKQHHDNEEARIQSEFFSKVPLFFPNLPDRLLFAVPNGGSRHKIEAANMKRQGVKRGVADVILQIPKKGYASLCLGPTGCWRKRPRRCRGTRVPWCIPTVDATAGGPDGSGSWNASG